MVRLAFLDGSLRPGSGNTARALDRAERALAGKVHVDRVSLATFGGTVEELAARLRAAEGFFVGTGTYWGSWGSPLQRFLEVMTGYEATDVFVGKPASVLVTMDSTAGSEVALRLAGTFVCLGCFTPPFGWMALSRLGVLATEAARGTGAEEDVWQLGDIAILAENLAVAAAQPRAGYRAWPIGRADAITGAYPAAGPLPPVAPDFG